MFLQNWKLALISIVMIPLASLAAKTLGKRIGKVTTEAQQKSGFLTTYLVELFKNHKLIKIFQKEQYEKDRANKFLYELKEKNQKIQTVFVRLSPVMEVLTGIMIAILIFYAGKLISIGELDINNFFSFLAAMMLAYQPVRSLSTLNMVLNTGLSAASRILPIIDQENNIKEIKDAKPINLNKSNIKFIDINFAYEIDEEKTLNSINLEFEGGKMTSLVGHSGSGKSTILNLIPRIYDAQSGDITIDNQSIYKSTLASLREEISMVSQETTLFDDTIKNNIKYANENASDDQIFEVAKLSFCDEFINKLPNKFETLIGENGVRLSGGENKGYQLQEQWSKEFNYSFRWGTLFRCRDWSQNSSALSILTKNKTTIVIAHRLLQF